MVISMAWHIARVIKNCNGETSWMTTWKDKLQRRARWKSARPYSLPSYSTDCILPDRKQYILVLILFASYKITPSPKKMVILYWTAIKTLWGFSSWTYFKHMKVHRIPIIQASGICFPENTGQIFEEVYIKITPFLVIKFSNRNWFHSLSLHTMGRIIEELYTNVSPSPKDHVWGARIFQHQMISICMCPSFHPTLLPMIQALAQDFWTANKTWLHQVHNKYNIS